MTQHFNKRRQPLYDTALKSLMEDHAAEIIPELLPGAVLLSETNVELPITTIRADLVYFITLDNEPCVLDLELQTDADGEMALRMLLYHVGLYDKHRLPVVSMAVYPFETTIPEPVFREQFKGKTLLGFEHTILRLWEMDAETFLRERKLAMYTLLPAMKGITAPMLLQAISEMEKQYTRQHLRHHLLRFRIILRRSKTLSERDKHIVEEKMLTYDSLLESDPDFQRKGVEGELKGKRESFFIIVEARFPDLLEMAQQTVAHLNTTESLNTLTKQLVLAPDEKTARFVLESFAA